MNKTIFTVALLQTAQAANYTLKEAANGRLFIGTAINKSHFGGQYSAVAAQHFNLVTAENECKFDAIQPEQGQFNFTGCDVVKSFADANKMEFRGHNFIWGQQVPSWVSALSPEGKRQALIDHITKVAPRYGNVAWDVVNEAIADNQDSKGNW